MDKRRINKAIQDCLTIGPLDNWDYRKKISAKYGEDILREILIILEYMNTIRPEWPAESFDGFLLRARKAIEGKYPLLKKESVDVLINRIAYGYK